MLVAVFALQTTASIAIAACNCPEMQNQTIQMDNSSGDMPCHEMDQEKADTDSGNDDNQMVDCNKCGCVNCTVTTSAALTNQLSIDQVVTANSVTLPSDDFMKSLFPFGIDYPPKHIS